ncbi:hypothetical protein L9F63_027998, partial [Diploptera punctata]
KYSESPAVIKSESREKKKPKTSITSEKPRRLPIISKSAKPRSKQLRKPRISKTESLAYVRKSRINKKVRKSSIKSPKASQEVSPKALQEELEARPESLAEEVRKPRTSHKCVRKSHMFESLEVRKPRIINSQKCRNSRRIRKSRW